MLHPNPEITSIMRAGHVEPTLGLAQSAPKSHALRLSLRPRIRTRTGFRRQVAGALGNLLSRFARRFAIRVRPHLEQLHLCRMQEPQRNHALCGW